jgi:hypothetical protein
MDLELLVDGEVAAARGVLLRPAPDAALGEADPPLEGEALPGAGQQLVGVAAAVEEQGLGRAEDAVEALAHAGVALAGDDDRRAVEAHHLEEAGGAGPARRRSPGTRR